MEFCASHRAAYEKLSDDAPFRLPKGWAWCKLEAISSLITDGEHKTPRRVNAFCGYYLLSARNIRDGYISLADVDYVDSTEFSRISPRCNPKSGDILISCSGSVGRCALVCDDNKYVMVRSAAMVSPMIVNSRYIMFTLQANIIQKQIQSKTKQTAQANLFQESIRNLGVPLPPLAEQKRIVTRIDELFKVADSLGAAVDGVEATSKWLDKKILDLAIRGKLVTQDPNDEPASELLKRIATTSHKSPCKNHETPIEPPFEIPESWEWAKLGTISNYGHCRSVDTQFISADTWSLDLEEIEKETGRLIVRKTAADKKSASSKHLFCKGMVLYSKLRTYLNKVLVADMDGICTSEIVPISVAAGIIPEFLRLVLMSPYFLQYTASKGYGVKMPRVGTNDMRESLIPIPPYAEQQRIVDRLHKLKHIVAFLSAP